MSLRIACIALLLAAAVSAAAPPDPGEALREAARGGALAEVKKLLDGGVPVDAPAPRHGQTALLFAAQGGHLEVVQLLLERGADINARESFFRSTPLSAALSGGHVEVARLLLAHGAHGAAEALSAAVEHSDLELARAALASGEIAPLELKAARRAAEAAPPALRDLLASAVANPRERKPYPLAPEKLASYAGRYRAEGKGEWIVSTRGEGLALVGTDGSDVLFQPVSEDSFETAPGDASLTFAGRAGLVEWAEINRDGEVTSLAAVTSDPKPLPSATAPAASEAAERGAPRPWPQFRGPQGSGIADGQGVPLSWDVAGGKNIRFKTAIPGVALSSPVIWGQKIFVTAAVSAAGDATFRTGLYGDGTSVDDLSEHTFRLYALDMRSGSVLWQREVHRGVPTVRRHLKSSLANATPVTDGERVVVLFGAVGLLAAYDVSGKPLWRREIGVLDCNDPQSGSAEWGHASSPILHRNLVIVQGDHRKDSFVAAYKLETGEQAWRVERDEASTWATPGLLSAASGDELVTNGRTIRAYDPASGRPLWSLGPNSEVVVATPVVGEGKVFLTAGYPPVRPIYAVRPGHRGDLTLPRGETRSAAVAWSHARGGTYIPTPILYRGHLYLVNNNGLLSCYRSDTGEPVYQTRLGGAGTAFSASPIAADGRLYFAAETGEVHVLRAGPELALLATIAMDEVVMASPAASDGLLAVRTLGHVVGIGLPAPAGE